MIQARIAVDFLELDTVFSLGKRVHPFLMNANQEIFCFNRPGDLHCVNLYTLALAYYFQGNLDKAAKLFQEAVTDAQTHQNLHIIALSTGHLGEVQMLQGHPDLAKTTFQYKAGDSRGPLAETSAFWGLVLVGLGELAFNENDLETAEAHYLKGTEIGKLWNNWECLLPGMLGLARISALRGEEKKAYEILDDLLEHTSSNALMVTPAVEAQRAFFQLQQGDLAPASRWAASFDADHPSAFLLQWEQCALVAAQIWLAQGQKPRAETFLQNLMSNAEKGGRKHTVQKIRSILNKNLIAPTQIENLIEPLSERELEVLQLMAEGMTHTEIAGKLYLSPNTLKAHAQNIYQKLNVHNRMEAVNKGREWHLI